MYVSDSPLFKSHSLLGRLSASFKFVNDHLLLFMRVGLLALLPFALVWALCYAAAALQVSAEASLMQSVCVGIALLCALAGCCAFQSLVYVWIMQFAKGEGCRMYAFRQLLQPLKAYALKVFASGLVQCVALVLCVLFCWGLSLLSPYTLIGTVPLALFVFLPFYQLPAVYVVDETSLGRAFLKSYRLGISTWGSLFSVVLVSVLLAGVLQLIGSLPWLLSVTAAMQSVSGIAGEAHLPAYFPALLFLFSLLAFVAMVGTQLLVTVAVAFQYGSAEARRLEWERESQSL